MSVLLYILSGITIMAGAALVGFGIPINEFSFGNTLISIGVTTIVGGLIIFGLGVGVGQLHRILDALTTRPPRPDLTHELMEAPLSAPAPDGGHGQIPVPPKAKVEAFPPQPHPLDEVLLPHPPHEAPYREGDDRLVAPTLHNPDEPPGGAAQPEAPPLPPRPRPMVPPLAAGGSDKVQRRDEGVASARGRPPMAGKAPVIEGHKVEVKPEPRLDLRPRVDTRAEQAGTQPEFKPEPKPSIPIEAPPTEMMSPREFASRPPAMPVEAEGQPQGGGRRSAAILKSGVVDGMAYTLYVDGSIEAELPQGTLHFASIDELRSHLEQHS